MTNDNDSATYNNAYISMHMNRDHKPSKRNHTQIGCFEQGDQVWPAIRNDHETIESSQRFLKQHVDTTQINKFDTHMYQFSSCFSTHQPVVDSNNGGSHPSLLGQAQRDLNDARPAASNQQIGPSDG